jgi:hypothetical protein
MNEQLTLQRATTKPLTLTPRVHPQVSRFVHESNKLPELTEALGSPLNMLETHLLSTVFRAASTSRTNRIVRIA